MQASEHPWRLVYTEAGRERAVKDACDEHKITVFLPLEKVQLRRKEPNRSTYKIVEAERPLFPNYIFIQLDSCWAIKHLSGVLTIVKQDGAPIRVPEAVIEVLRGVCNEDGVLQASIPKPKKAFSGAVGDFWRIKEGPFAGFVAQISSIETVESLGEVRMWLQMLGSGREIGVPLQAVGKMVQKASPQAVTSVA